MGRKRYTPEQIIRLLRQSEVLSSEGRNVPEICREIGSNSEHLLPLEEGIRRYAGQSGKTIKRTRARELKTQESSSRPYTG